ncbi:DUF2282 domain-containing protein [Shewanella sp. SG41-4]|uniref:BufA1 family periplasmic bufferin-type metallophore n=1 Tax=Shewanella sp. SG41-4 TaxID=2760976 RepID=UPI0016002C00|nr:DUF2282 domain-containing protein [Shewanella sp. SG41-4]MBB1440929.1 DUF2282 domain-containing protein [Shewanella sp. SG41-4]
MKNKQLLARAALVVALASTVTAPAQAAGKEKCYGVAMAGQNDCANLAGTHSCAGQSSLDKDFGEWKLVAKGTCEDLGGLLKAAAQEKWTNEKAKG